MKKMWQGVAAVAVCLVSPVAQAGVAQAAMLRPLTQLSRADVLLSDLFDDAGPLAGRVLGPAPAPGDSIVVEAPQLAAIAREYGVALRPASPDDRATLRRAGVALPREAVLQVLRQALAAAGAPDGDMALPAFEAPMVPPEASASVAVEQLAFAPGDERFTAGLLVTGRGMAMLRLRVSGRLEAMQAALVAVHRLLPGDIVRAVDLRQARVPAATLHGGLIEDATQAEGLAVLRPVAAGQPVPLADLGRPEVVARGDRVAIRLVAGGIEMTASGTALEAGARGARIRVLNPVSRAVVLAEVTGADAVEVDPGSVPLRAGADASTASGNNAGLTP